MISSFNSIEKWLWGIWPITDYNFNIPSSHFIFYVWHTVTEQLEIFFHFCRFSLLLFPFYMHLFHFCLYFLCFWGLVQKTIASTRVLKYSFCFLLIFSNFPDFNRSSSSIFVFFFHWKYPFIIQYMLITVSPLPLLPVTLHFLFPLDPLLSVLH